MVKEVEFYYYQCIINFAYIDSLHKICTNINQRFKIIRNENNIIFVKTDSLTHMKSNAFNISLDVL